jgi:predicted dehydrogenase
LPLVVGFANELVVISLSEEDVRVAVIGLGKMGLLHASILSVLPHVRLVALCDKSHTLLRLFRKMFKVNLMDDVVKLSSFDLDAAYVTTPIPTHFSIVRALYLNKIASSVFVEKTLAASYDQASELCALAERYQGVNMVGYMKRFAVTFGKAKDLLDQGALGGVLTFDAYAYSSDFVGVAKNSKASMGRGCVLNDLGAHVVDLALWFFEDSDIESARLESPVIPRYQDSARFTVKTTNGILGTFDISWCKENYRMPEFCVSVKGSKGSMKVSDDKLELEQNSGRSYKWYRQDLKDNVGFLLGEPEYFRENQHFIEAILKKHDAKPDFSTASRVDNLIDQVKQRAAKNE